MEHAAVIGGFKIAEFIAHRVKPGAQDRIDDRKLLGNDPLMFIV